jgi:hypothetical protein
MTHESNGDLWLMDGKSIQVALISAVFLYALWIYANSKLPGFGRYTAPLLVSILVLFAGTVTAVLGIIDGPSFAHLLYALGGFVGGLVVGPFILHSR